MDSFLFWFYFVGLIVVACQDLKRREIDDWLNLLLLVGGSVYVLYSSFLDGNMNSVFVFALLLFVMLFVQGVFYFGRVFAGGDAKTLFAMTPVFLIGSFYGSLLNVGIFILFLLVVGSIYGLVYSGFLYVRNFDKVNKEMISLVAGRWSLIVVPIVLMLLGFWKFSFFLFGGWVLLFMLLIVFAKGLENVFMIREVNGEDLMEGDWLVEDVRVGEKVVRADWEGLGLEEIRLLKGKKVLIKDGIPFGPVFFFAFLFYVFLRSWFLGLFLF